MKYAVKLHMFRKAHIHTQLPGSVVNDKLIVSEFPTNMFGNEFFLQPFFLTVATIMFLAKKQGPQSGCLARDRLPITIFLLHTFPSLIGLAGILHSVQKLRVILDKLPRAFDCFLSLYDIHAYIKSLTKAKSNYRGYIENPAHQKFFIHFFIDNSNANISLHTLSCPKSKFRQLKAYRLMFALELSMKK